MKFIAIFFLVSASFLYNENVYTADGDITHVITHDKTYVITDPSRGYNAFKSIKEFPSQEVKYRKAILYVTYQCPDSQKCGEWDYIDNIFLRKQGSENDTVTEVELARMISPYGSRFTPDWKFKWKADITDFAFLLHDSVEIEFNHTGYESNTDRGWLVTLDFELTEGTPVMEVLGYEKLWTGSFPFGDSNNGIENYLTPVTFKNRYGADIARLRILQTGHGMDDFENCAEFCNKYRNIFFDDELIEQKQIWRECSDNPLYPQAGTWIFDRANWCPGAMVYADVYDLILNENPEHIINIDMEPYVNPNKPSANYVFSSYIFYYKKPQHENDASLEEIISPGMEDIYSRMNPVCNFPLIKIKNNGSNILTSLKISYGINSDTENTFDWKGHVESLGTKEIVLPEIFSYQEGRQIFNVQLTEPNGMHDEYVTDNKLSSEFIMPPVFDPVIILNIKTNNEPEHTFYQVSNQKKFFIRQKSTGSLGENILIKDTLRLNKGCYQFILGDTANDGLDFWFNPKGGYGYVRITDINGKLIKAYNSDFGKEIRQQFIVTGGPSIKDDNTPVLNIFPIRNPGKFFCDIFLNEKQNIILEITTEDKKRTVYTKKLKDFKEGMVDVELNKEKDGLYFVNVITKAKTVSKKMKLKRDN